MPNRGSRPWPGTDYLRSHWPIVLYVLSVPKHGTVGQCDHALRKTQQSITSKWHGIFNPFRPQKPPTCYILSLSTPPLDLDFHPLSTFCFLSSVQVRCSCCCLWFRSRLTWEMWQLLLQSTPPKALQRSWVGYSWQNAQGCSHSYSCIFTYHSFPPNQLSINVLWYTALLTAGLWAHCSYGGCRWLSSGELSSFPFGCRSCPKIHQDRHLVFILFMQRFTHIQYKIFL